MSEKTLLTAKNISKSYKNGDITVDVLKNIDFSAGSGEKIAVLGPSGSGKTTLLNVLAGIDSFDSGEICFGEYDYSAMKPKQLADMRINNFGFVFQSYNLISTLNAYDNIILPLCARKKMFEQSEIEKIAERLGINDILGRFPSQLSGGEQQRVCIARALAGKPEIIFSDEATGNLDAKNTKTVMDLFCECCAADNITLIFVTHDETLTSYADRVLRFDEFGGLN